MVAFGIPRRMNRDAAVRHGVHGRLGQLVHPDEPLVGQVGFDRRLAAIGVGQVDFAILDFDQQSRGVQVGDHALARRRDRQSRVGAGLALSVPSGLRMLIIGSPARRPTS